MTTLIDIAVGLGTGIAAGLIVHWLIRAYRNKSRMQNE